MVLETKSAKAEVQSAPIRNFVALLGIMKSVVAARLGGSYKSNPFFVEDSGTPIKQPRVLTEAERTTLNLSRQA
jgi:hypothetical protein